MPTNAIYVGRPTLWGNPFKVGHRYEEGDSFMRHYGHLLDNGLVTAENCLVAYEAWLRNVYSNDQTKLKMLRGYDLACWCPLDAPCHADVLLRLVNSDAPPVCPCINWARDADDVMREHHPRCAEGNPVPLYVNILLVRDDYTRRLLLTQFIEKHFPSAYNVLTKGTER